MRDLLLILRREALAAAETVPMLCRKTSYITPGDVVFLPVWELALKNTGAQVEDVL